MVTWPPALANPSQGSVVASYNKVAANLQATAFHAVQRSKPIIS
jgi:hypothetical protein